MKTSPGRLEIVFAGLTLLTVVLWLAPGASLYESLLVLAVMIMALVLFTRHWRVFVQKLLWRLRNRLIVAYLLIALIPVLLLTAVIGLSGYIVLGQVSAHLLTSQLDRNTGMLRGAMRLLAVAGPGAATELRQNLPPTVARTFPGLHVIESGGGTVRHWPPDSTLSEPPTGWEDTDGMVLREGVLWGWAHVQENGRSVTGLFPLTRDFLGDIAPNLGESIVLASDLSAPVTPATARREGTRNRLPPALNRFDIQINWPSPVRFAVWDRPGTYQDGILVMRTRVSAVWRAISPQTTEIGQPSAVTVLILIGVAFIAAQLAALYVGVSLTRTITGAVHDLYEGTARVTRGDFAHRIPIQGRDQLAELGMSFNQMTGNVERLLQVEKDRQRIQNDLEIAREVQDQLYPRTVPEVEELCITAARSPARLVSGDYYDFQKLTNGDVAVAIGDVAGKGISAALLMATLQSSFRMELRAALETELPAGGAGASVSPSEVVSHLNKHLYEFTSPEKYATFFCGVYQRGTSTLHYTNAGHLPPILVRHGRCSRLDVNGMVVGAFPFAQYAESQIRLEPGDLLVLFTDGISEPENEYGEMFGEERIADLATRAAGLDDQALVSEIMGAVLQWTGSEELQDDMTLVVMRRR